MTVIHVSIFRFTWFYTITTWFFLIRVLKTEFGFQNTHTVFNEIRVSFKIRMCVLKTKFDFQNTNVVFDHTFQIRYFFANSVNFEIIVKTRFGFQNTNLDLKNRMWFYMKTKCGFLI